MRATSLIVGRFPGLLPVRAGVVSSSVKLGLSLCASQHYIRAALDAMPGREAEKQQIKPVDTGFHPLQSSAEPTTDRRVTDSIGTWRDGHSSPFGGPGVSAAVVHSAGDPASIVAARFVEARLECIALPDYPGVKPASMDEAYATQEAAIGLFPDAIIGWKVGMVPPAQQAALHARRLAGPIFRRNLWTPGLEPTPLPAIVGGFAAVEAEFVARVAAVDPDQMDWTLDEATRVVAALHIGVELAGSPLSTINDLGSAVVASDFGNNGGLVLGSEIEDWAARLDGIEVETIIDGETVGSGTAGSIPAGVLESVRFLLEHCARRGRLIAEGTLISTGAVTGVHQIPVGARSVCAFSGVGEIHCLVVAAGT